MKPTLFRQQIFRNLFLIVAVVCLGVYVIFSLNRLNDAVQTATEVHGKSINLSEQIRLSIISQKSLDQKFTLTKDQDYYQAFVTIENEVIKYIDQLSVLLSALKETSPENLESLRSALQCYQQYTLLLEEQHDAFSGTVSTFTGGNDRLVAENKKKQLCDRIETELLDLQEQLSKHRIEQLSKIKKISLATSNFAGILAIVSIIMVFIISYLNTSGLKKFIHILKKQTHNVAEGSPLRLPDMKLPKELGSLLQDFNVMSDKLEQADEIKQDFISHISHELRTPLTSIREASELLMDGVYEDRPDKERELFELIQNECGRLIDSTNMILDHSRMEAGMMDYDMKKHDIVEVVRKVILSVALIAQKKNIALELIPPDGMPLLQMDAGCIGRVVENLLSNAIKYTPDEGSVTVKIGRRDKTKKMVKVTVADSGPGIASEDLEKVFNKFERITSFDQSVIGTGIGLSIAEHIINAHGGKIWAKSKLGHGTTFAFTLPVP